MSEPEKSLGTIYVSNRAIATIASQSALESYGVVGMTAKTFIKGLTGLIMKDPTSGVEVNYDGKRINVDLYIVVEYGTRIKSVADSVSNSVRYQIEKALGLAVNDVNVHVRGLRISNPD